MYHFENIQFKKTTDELIAQRHNINNNIKIFVTKPKKEKEEHRLDYEVFQNVVKSNIRYSERAFIDIENSISKIYGNFFLMGEDIKGIGIDFINFDINTKRDLREVTNKIVTVTDTINIELKLIMDQINDLRDFTIKIRDDILKEMEYHLNLLNIAIRDGLDFLEKTIQRIQKEVEDILTEDINQLQKHIQTELDNQKKWLDDILAQIKVLLNSK